MSALDALVDQLADAIARKVVELQRVEAERDRTRYLTPAEMGERLGITEKTLANMRAAKPKRGPKFTKVAGRVVYPITDGNGS